MRLYRELTFFGAALALSLAPAVAQDTGAPEPAKGSAEIGDFRLDPKPEQPVLKVEPEVVIAPAPKSAIAKPAPPQAKQRVDTQKSAGETRNKTPSEREEAPTIRHDRVMDPTDNAPELSAGSEPALETGTQPVVEPVAETTSATAEMPSLPTQSFWLWLIPAAVVLIGFGLLWRRRTQKRHAFAEMATDDDFDAGSNDEVVAPQASRITEQRNRDPVKTPHLTLTFEPQQAQLSLANFTVSGRLVIQNTGAASMRELALRTAMISASDTQAQAIQQFFDDGGQAHSENLGLARAGEEIALSLEIQQPRNALQLFDWNQRQFIAPIVLVHLTGKGSEGKLSIAAAYLLGRTGAGGSNKLIPLPIDRGPRSFDTLSARRIAE